MIGHCVSYRFALFRFWSLVLDHRVNFFLFFLLFSFPHLSPSLTLTPFFFLFSPYVSFLCLLYCCCLVALLPHCLFVLPPCFALCIACCLIFLPCHLIASFALPRCIFHTTLPPCHVASSCYVFTLLCCLVALSCNFVALCATSLPRYLAMLPLRVAIVHCLAASTYLLTPLPHLLLHCLMLH